MPRQKKSTEQFIKESKEIWGEDRWDYSKTVYTGHTNKCIFICKKHQIEFKQTPAQHTVNKACGCKECRREAKSFTTEDFIKKAREVHGDKYNYDKVNYVNARTKVIITCPIHGDFEQNPNSHLQGKGCWNCERDRRSLDSETFIKKAKQVHGDKYDYSKVKYINRNTPVIIICPIHGEFEQIPSNHLQGKGCFRCSKNYQYDTEEFIRRAKEIHENKYDYSKVEYKTAKTEVCITCTEHGKFWQTPDIHLRGCGCPKCKLKSQTKLYEKLKESFPNEEILFEVGNNTVSWLEGQRFDIYFPKYNIAVEYNGIQHYESIEFFNGKEGFEDTLKRDESKRQKCKENNCRLFEIKYNYSEEDYSNLINNIKELI